MICPDFMEFQDILQKMRVVDDKIAYSLNTSLPTQSFQKTVNTGEVCKDLQAQIDKVHTQRSVFIKNCIVVTAEKVKQLKEAKAEKPDDFEIMKNLNMDQRKLRLLQTELSVEEVINDKTKNLFKDKCKQHYSPDNYNL